MQAILQSPILILIVLGAGIVYYFRSAKGASGRLNGSLILSIIAALVFSYFIVIGLLLLFSDTPTNTLFPDIQLGVLRAIGGGLALFGMFGLLIARGLAVLISIEHSLQAGLNKRSNK